MLINRLARSRRWIILSTTLAAAALGWSLHGRADHWLGPALALMVVLVAGSTSRRPSSTSHLSGTGSPIPPETLLRWQAAAARLTHQPPAGNEHDALNPTWQAATAGPARQPPADNEHDAPDPAQQVAEARPARWLSADNEQGAPKPTWQVAEAPPAHRSPADGGQVSSPEAKSWTSIVAGLRGEGPDRTVLSTDHGAFTALPDWRLFTKATVYCAFMTYFLAGLLSRHSPADPVTIAFVAVPACVAAFAFSAAWRDLSLRLTPEGIHDRRLLGSTYIPWTAGPRAFLRTPENDTTPAIEFWFARPDLVRRHGLHSQALLRTPTDPGFLSRAIYVYATDPARRPDIGTAHELRRLDALRHPAI